MGAELLEEDPAVLGVIDGHHDEMDAAAGKRRFERRRQTIRALHRATP